MTGLPIPTISAIAPSPILLTRLICSVFNKQYNYIYAIDGEWAVAMTVHWKKFFLLFDVKLHEILTK